MLFSQFSDYLQKIEGISSRLQMTHILAELFLKLEVGELKNACYLMQGRLVPLYQSLEFNLSEKMILKALARISRPIHDDSAANLFGETDFLQLEIKVKQKYKQLGDLGLLSQQILAESKTSDEQLNQIFSRLKQVAEFEGIGSQDQKINALVDLLKSVSPLSAKFIVRIILGKMRLGFSNMTMIDALSWAVAGDKSESKLLEGVYNKKADIGEVALNYLSLRNLSVSERREKIEQLKVKVSIPVVPALCQRLNSATEMIEKMGQVIVEPKYDGIRIQIHFDRQKKLIQAFTRNLEDVSASLPELKNLPNQTKANSLILDAEAIGYDSQSGKLLAFQQTITRRRKYDIDQKAEEVPIRFYIFDILEYDNHSLIAEKLHERKDRLKKIIIENETFKLTPFVITEKESEITAYHEKQLSLGLEGIVVKKVDGQYESGRKGWTWVKMKEEEGTSGKLSDTLDLIVMGYYLGKGKRAGLGLGAILVGVKQDEKILTVAKIGTGMSDEILQQLARDCQKIKIVVKPSLYQVPKELVPDVWVNPEIVLEIAADEITNSPLHSAGLALRFPRLIKIRADKGIDQATTLSELKQIGGISSE